MARKKVTPEVEVQVLTRSRRRCCICFWLDGIETRVKGQIAHIDQNSENSVFDNLAYLCLEHHDEYDGRTSVSKGLQPTEVKLYRDRLYKELDWDKNPPTGQKSGSEVLRNTREPDGPDFLEYLQGLNGDELYRLAVAVIGDRSQSISCGRIDQTASTLKSKGFLVAVRVTQTLDQMARKQPVPYTIPPAPWRYLNDNKKWLLDTAIERNVLRLDRATELNLLVPHAKNQSQSAPPE